MKRLFKNHTSKIVNSQPFVRRSQLSILNCSLIAIFLLSVFSCKDYLDVESESKYGDAYVYAKKEEANMALNAVYAALLSGDVYGEKYMRHYALNSDVEFSTFNTMMRTTGGNDFKCFDGESHSSDAAATWKAAYWGVERANLLIHGLENSALLNDEKEQDDIYQMIGEGKTLRAMFLHDLVVHFGDIPFPTKPTILNESLVLPIEDRNVILTWLINDLKSIAPKMKSVKELSDGVERTSQEFCWALIARMALTRGGYSLYPDKSNPTSVGKMERPSDYRDYYAIASEYAGLVIDSKSHSLTKPFVKVFVDQCNFIRTDNDDPIFEIPFTKGHNGQVGYIHGPQGNVETGSGETTGTNTWGRSAGNVKLNAFYRFSFDRTDLRNKASVGLWYYTYDGVPTFPGSPSFSDYSNKWSKFWSASGTFTRNSEGNTGINFPYMRYADVLLMYAEAVNELEDGVQGDNGATAQAALATVRSRAFDKTLHPSKVNKYVDSVSFSKEKFFNAIFNERKWEFGGENIRWKDLVRWGLYSKVAYESFMAYYTMGAISNGEYLEDCEQYMQPPYMNTIYYNNHARVKIANPNDIYQYQNTSLYVLKIENLYGSLSTPPTPNAEYNSSATFSWGTDGLYPRDECCFSFRGYIRGGYMANYTQFVRPTTLDEARAMKPVRYILPIPRQVVLMSNGIYTNYYGY